MTKRNEKGFFLSETMVVIAVVAVVLIAVFKLFSSVYMNFEQSEKYDTAYAITALANVQKYYESVEKIDTSVVSRAIPYVELTNSETYNSDYYTKLKEEFEIDNIYLIDLQYIYDSSMYNQFYVTLRKYVKTLRNVNGIVLVITVNGNEFAYSKIENYGDVTLIGDASDEYALYIPKNGEFVDPGYENWSGDAPTITWEDGKIVDTSKPGTYYMHYDFNGYMLRRKVVVGSHEGVMYLNHLYNIFSEENGLIVDDTEDENLRYAGANPNNYVEFNNELWRIIGVFDVASEIGGAKVPRIKLVRDESLESKKVWDSVSPYLNEWEGSEIEVYLNDGDLSYYSSLSVSAKNQIGTSQSIWYVGSSPDNIASVVYENERKDVTGVQNYIGLIYVSDFGFAGVNCGNSVISGYNNSCGPNNWLTATQFDGLYWTISPFADVSGDAWVINSSGRAISDGVGGIQSVRPSVYLKSDIEITSGQGTKSNPYKLSL